MCIFIRKFVVKSNVSDCISKFKLTGYCWLACHQVGGCRKPIVFGQAVFQPLPRLLHCHFVISPQSPICCQYKMAPVNTVRPHRLRPPATQAICVNCTASILIHTFTAWSLVRSGGLASTVFKASLFFPLCCSQGKQRIKRKHCPPSHFTTTNRSIDEHAFSWWVIC